MLLKSQRISIQHVADFLSIDLGKTLITFCVVLGHHATSTRTKTPSIITETTAPSTTVVHTKLTTHVAHTKLTTTDSCKDLTATLWCETYKNSCWHNTIAYQCPHTCRVPGCPGKTLGYPVAHLNPGSHVTRKPVIIRLQPGKTQKVTTCRLLKCWVEN